MLSAADHSDERVSDATLTTHVPSAYTRESGVRVCVHACHERDDPAEARRSCDDDSHSHLLPTLPKKEGGKPVFLFFVRFVYDPQATHQNTMHTHSTMCSTCVHPPTSKARCYCPAQSAARVETFSPQKVARRRLRYCCFCPSCPNQSTALVGSRTVIAIIMGSGRAG